MTDLAPEAGYSETVTVDGCAFHTVRSGEGPPVVLVHGGPGLWDYLGPVAAMIERRASVFRYDQRACGRSHGEGPHTIARHVADLEALREHWGLERFTLIGHSWGASLGLHYALEHSRRLEGLIYMSGTGVDPAWRGDYHARRLQHLGEAGERERLAAAERWASDSSIEAEHAACIAGWRADYADIEAGREHARAMLVPGLRVNRAVNAELNLESSRFTISPEMPDRLRALQVPTLVIHGGHDPRPAWAARQVAELIPHARFLVLEDAGHCPWVETPHALSGALEGFLAALAPAPRRR
ncbi:MAG TPA: alpha/beta fold hydrolase [Caulobacteraceae bacterium]|jgi:proline iminopeptidase|nr:alpha/beta fold hydrolase [Caulobacteraceae bacterium]